MRAKTNLCLILISSLFTTVAISQDRPSPKIQLTDAPLETRLNYAVWRTD